MDRHTIAVHKFYKFVTHTSIRRETSKVWCQKCNCRHLIGSGQCSAVLGGPATSIVYRPREELYSTGVWHFMSRTTPHCKNKRVSLTQLRLPELN